MWLTHYSCPFIILFNTGLCKSALCNYLFKKLAVLSFYAFCVYFFRAKFDVIFLNVYNICIMIVYCRPSGLIYSPARMRKNLTIFKGCHYSRFYKMISLSFREIETKNLNPDPRILIFLVLETTSSAAHYLSKDYKW